MTAFISWYLIATLLGWLTFPLAFRLFPALADRGFSLARAAGLLTWAYVFWLLTSLGLSSNNVGGILFGLLPLDRIERLRPICLAWRRLHFDGIGITGGGKSVNGCGATSAWCSRLRSSSWSHSGCWLYYVRGIRPSTMPRSRWS